MRGKWRLPLLRLLLLLIGAGVLEVLCALDIIDRLTMQPPHQIFFDLVHIVWSGTLNHAILHTLSNVMIACALALVVGIVFGSIIHRMPPLREALDLVFSTWYAIPILAFYPLLIVVFGLGDVPQIVIGFMQGVVAVIVSMLDGLDRVPRVLGKLARVQKMNRLETTLQITLPAAAPWVLTGAKLAIMFSIIGVVASEFLMARDGLGYELSYAYNNFDNARMYPIIVLVITFSVLVNSLLFRWETHLLRQRGLRP
jgi:NitT/TauT family transport system permease protein